jgi:hypothetical protein
LILKENHTNIITNIKHQRVVNSMKDLLFHVVRSFFLNILQLFNKFVKQLKNEYRGSKVSPEFSSEFRKQTTAETSIV